MYKSISPRTPHKYGRRLSRYTKQSHDLADSSKFNPEMLNDHYAGISTDQNHTRPTNHQIDDSQHCKTRMTFQKNKFSYIFG